MLDRSIPFYNTIMKHPGLQTPDALSPAVPEGITLRSYREGDEKGWAKLHTATGDFSSPEEAEEYFRGTYLSHKEELEKRAVFAVTQKDNRVVGACIAWRDPVKPSLRAENPDAGVAGDVTVASVHWLVVAEDEQRKGIGRAIMTEILKKFARFGEAPVYLHTQPWSWKAILLYDSLGFRLQKTDTFGDYEVQYPQAAETLTALTKRTDGETLSAEGLRRILSCAE